MNSNSFREVAQESGIEWSRHRGNEAFSIAWVDFNNDGYLDAWISGHGYNGASQQYPDGKYPYLYLNNGDGTFSNLFDSDWRGGSGGDVHGTTWVDFDNDGDQDFLAAGGGRLGDIGNVDTSLLTNKLFVNNGGTLEEEGVARGIDNVIARSRSSVWFDGNNDGLLDVVVVTALRDDDQGYTAYFEQQADGTFVDRTFDVGLEVNESARYAQLADITGDGNLDLIIQGTYTSPLNIYDFSSGTIFEEVTDLVPQLSDAPADPTFDFADHSSARDSIIADFNNDGHNDIYLTRSRIFTPEATIFQGSDTIASADLILQGGGEIGLSFQTEGLFAFDSFDFSGRDAINAPSGGFDVNNIFIGAEGRLATEEELAAIFGSGYDSSLTAGSDACVFCGEDHSGHNHSSAAFQLDPNDPTVAGIKSDRTARGIYIGYEPRTNTWEIRVSSPANELVRVAVESDQEITNLSEINFTSADPNNLALSDQFLVYDPVSGEYQDLTVAAGLDAPTLSQSAVAADFDNDMDLDIYIANAYPSFNQPNILYENDGNGNFTRVELAAGAAGSEVGIHRLDFEVGQRLAIADYDNDGFVDILAGSTTARSPRKTYLGTPTQLFRNEEGINGNTNNWLQIDLQGIQSNRDAIGARVLITTPDGVTQVREQNGGTHVFAQNSSRLHFGLGQNETISSLVVQWPSGEVTTLNNVAINQIIDIVENFPSIITGDSGNDSLLGGTQSDQILGLDGNDTLIGANNNDSLEGGTGDDSLVGGNDNDTLIGGSGRDTLIGGSGNDLLNGGGWRDSLQGNNGTDTLFGGDGDDTLSGGADQDVLSGENGNDSLLGGTGNDALNGNDDNDTLYGEAGSDTLDGGSGNDLLGGGEDNDLLLGGTGQDLLRGNRGRDTLEGDFGNDTLNGNEGDDILSGGADDDILVGEGGADVLDGGAGNDTLRGSNGNDILDGGDGSDRLIEFNNSDFILTNTQLIARGTDSISNFESARLVGGTGNNLLDASTVTELELVLEGAAGDDTLFGGTQNDTLKGLNDDDSLQGQDGDDSILGGNGNDTLTGSQGNDTIFGGNGTDLLFESADTDFRLTTTQLTSTATGIDRLGGIETAHLIAVASSANRIFNADGANIQVTLETGSGNDTVIGGARNDILSSGAGNDTLRGNNGDDYLDGGAGNDTLVGSGGNDTLVGGTGSDRFNFNSLSHAEDNIVDFAPGSDRLNISASGFNGGLTANRFLNADQFTLGTTANDSSDRFIYDSDSGRLFFDADGNGSNSQIVIANLDNRAAITEQDIFITA